MPKSHTAMSDHPSLSYFADLADQFCRHVEQHDRLEVVAFLQRVHSLLPPLYSAALALPHSDSLPAAKAQAEDDFTREAWEALYRSLGRMLGCRDHYQEMFAPYDWSEDKPVTGSLADDLADIYSDLRRGLQFWKAGAGEAAIWQWRFDFEYHWSEHATSALRALRALAFSHNWDEPETPASEQA